MRFAFVMPYYLPDGITGGAEKQAYLLAKELVKRGHTVLFLSLNPKNRAEVEEDEGIRVVRRLKHRGKLQFLDYPTVLRELLRFNPDVVISRIRFYYLPMAIYSLMRGKVSVAFIPENSLSTPFPELRKLLRALPLNPKTPLYIAHALLIDLLSQTGLLLSKIIIVQNAVQGRNVRRFFLRKSIKLPSIFVPPDVRIDKDGEPLIVWVGNARREKRPELFVDLAKRLPEYRFVMIGRKTERFKGKVPNLEVLGELPHDRALRWIGRAWVLVHTSMEAGEGFPNVFLEAWYLRTLVLSCDTDPDNLLSSGLGVKVEGVEGAVMKLRELVEDGEVRKEIVERAYRYVLENHLPEAVVPKFLRVVSKAP